LLLASAVGASVGAPRLQGGCISVSQLTASSQDPRTTPGGALGAQFGFQPFQVCDDGGPLG
jgi:hypothetical protein